MNPKVVRTGPAALVLRRGVERTVGHAREAAGLADQVHSEVQVGGGCCPLTGSVARGPRIALRLHPEYRTVTAGDTAPVEAALCRLAAMRAADDA
ncbi:hypothetical protein [Streptomyces sp. NPDC001450]